MDQTILHSNNPHLNIKTKFLYYLSNINFCLIHLCHTCRTISVPKDAIESASSSSIQVLTHQFTAAPEQLRPPRKVRVGLFQNKLPLPTTTPVGEQRAALHQLAEKAISVAAKCGVNIFCFQETWSTSLIYIMDSKKLIQRLLLRIDHLYRFCILFTAMAFAFCTRERLPWIEIAENAEEGPTTRFLQQVLDNNVL